MGKKSSFPDRKGGLARKKVEQFSGVGKKKKKEILNSSERQGEGANREKEGERGKRGGRKGRVYRECECGSGVRRKVFSSLFT